MLIYGRHAVIDAIKSNYPIKKIFVTATFFEKEKDEISKCNFEIVDVEVINKQCKENHQGIIANASDFKYQDIDYSCEKILILDHLEDMHNFGAIMRVCEALGYTQIIIPKDRSVSVTPTVFKTSQGAISNIKISQVTNLVREIKKLKDLGYWVVGTAVDNATHYQGVDYKGKMVIIIGNEHKGMTQSVMNECDFLVTLPMVGKVNSLNASVACGVLLYEVFNQNCK